MTTTPGTPPLPPADAFPDPATLSNPYWDAVQRIARSERRGVANVDRYIENYLGGKCDELVQTYSYAVPDPPTLLFLARWLWPAATSMGCGTGYLEWMLEQMGVAIRCYDEKPPDRMFTNYYHSPRRTNAHGKQGEYAGMSRGIFHPMEVGTPPVLAAYGGVPLLLSWPPNTNEMASQCLRHYPGPRLVYIGYERWGETATEDFFDALERDWREVARHHIARWYCAEDDVVVYERLVETHERRAEAP